MKKIKFIESIAGHGSPARTGEPMFSFMPGDIVDIEPNLADAWVASGIAAWAPKVTKAETAVTKATAYETASVEGAKRGN